MRGWEFRRKTRDDVERSGASCVVGAGRTACADAFPARRSNAGPGLTKTTA